MDCNGCTVCCTMFPIPDLGLKAGEPCKHAVPGVGCEIYDDRPNDCKVCDCVYHTASAGHEDIRPDNLGVVFEKIKDTMIFGTIDPKIMMLGETAKGQINSFVQEGLDVVLHHPRISNLYVFSSEGKTEDEVHKEFGEYMEKFMENNNDST